jgi:DNA modification methylase
VSDKQRSNNGSGSASQRECSCGARRIDAQLGLERTPEAYVASMVAVFREVRRVLRDDGTLWLNLGDSYCPSGANKSQVVDSARRPKTRSENCDAASGKAEYLNGTAVRPAFVDGLKPKDLVGIPWRVAFALQEDGWYLRSDIIWAKPNPMPESVTDRPTKSHEYLFLLTKSARYYYDAKAIAEPSVCPDARMLDGFVPKSDNGKHAGDPQSRASRLASNTNGARAAGGAHDNVFGPTRNARSVWTIATSPYPEAHFATFPPELPRRCILAGSKAGDTVLDPFAGAGTTGLVADRLGRNFIGLELNPKYVALSRRRIAADCPLFAQETK